MTPKDLEALSKVCRKYGIVDLSIQGVSLKFDPNHKVTEAAKKLVEKAQDAIETPELTEEEVLFYSSTPHSLK